MTFVRDPMSVLLDSGARRLLARAYAHPGEWVGTKLADPSPRTRAYAAARGINLDAADDPSTPGGTSRRTDAKTRWCRAFVRAIYYQHKWYSGGGTQGWRGQRRTTARDSGALRFEVGRRRPGGRAVRIKLDRGGARKLEAVQRLPDSQRIYDDTGEPAGRHSDPRLRDWG